jgi:UrcA family protein
MVRMNGFRQFVRTRHPAGPVNSTAGLAIAALAYAVMCSVGGATQSDEDLIPQITVKANQKVSTKQVGVSYTGIPIEEIQLTRHVGYGDLDLSSPEGRAALDKRIKETAKKACEQLNSLYPLEQWITDDNQTCVDRATDAAITQEKTIIAAASRK